LGERKVGGEEEVEGGAVNDLGGEGGRGLVGGFGADSCLLLECGEKRGQKRLKIGSGRDVHSLLCQRQGRSKENCDGEQESLSVAREKEGIRHGAP